MAGSRRRGRKWHRGGGAATRPAARLQLRDRARDGCGDQGFKIPEQAEHATYADERGQLRGGLARFEALDGAFRNAGLRGELCLRQIFL